MTNKINAQAGEWEAYEKLPRSIRDALKSAGRDYSSVDALQMLTDIRKRGVSDDKAIPFILNQISFLDRHCGTPQGRESGKSQMTVHKKNPKPPAMFKINDVPKFTEMWLAGASTADICACFGVTANYVSDKGKLLGLPKRTGKVRARPKVIEVTPEPPVKIRSDRIMPPGWTEQMDVSLALTRGKYAQLEEVAVKYQIPVQRAVARFLQVRA